MPNHWPGGVRPRDVATAVIEALQTRKRQCLMERRQMSPCETYAIIDEVIAANPGCAEDIVRGHVEAVKVRR